jgi:hypothetical protein
MTTRAGINGFGRIGRALTRLALDRADLEVAEEALCPVPVSLTLSGKGDSR